MSQCWLYVFSPPWRTCYENPRVNPRSTAASGPSPRRPASTANGRRTRPATGSEPAARGDNGLPALLLLSALLSGVSALPAKLRRLPHLQSAVLQHLLPRLVPLLPSRLLPFVSPSLSVSGKRLQDPANWPGLVLGPSLPFVETAELKTFVLACLSANVHCQSRLSSSNVGSIASAQMAYPFSFGCNASGMIERGSVPLASRNFGPMSRYFTLSLPSSFERTSLT